MNPLHLCSTLDEATQCLEVRTATTELEISQLREALKTQHYLGAGRPAGHVLWQGVYQIRYFITSIEPGKRTHQQFAAIIRQHRSIENLNHWKRYSSMWREDRSSLRCAKGAKNLALLRNAALAILPFEQHSSLNAAFDHYRDYRGKSLKLIKNARPFPE